MNKNNVLIVVAGPSGVGKGTVCAKVFDSLIDLEFSVSATTRKPREGEVDGVNYFYVSQDKFDQMIEKNEFLEYANVFDNKYGTPKEYVFNKLKSGKDVLLEIDVQGAMMVMESCSDAVFIFILPPDKNELTQRLINRGTESKEQLDLRINKAKEEIGYADKFDYVVVNDKVDLAAQQVISIITSEKCKTEKNMEFINNLMDS